jgi:SAM-dependent methyltransferase
MPGERLYTDLSEYYEGLEITDQRDINGEVSVLKTLIDKHCESEPEKLLDIGCGTGNHIALLESEFECVGVDANRGILKHARAKSDSASYIQSDMESLALSADEFDVVTCLESSLNYVSRPDLVPDVVSEFARQITPGGVLILGIAPYDPDQVTAGMEMHDIVTYDGDDVAVSGVQTSRIQDNTLEMEITYVVSEGYGKTETVTDQHKLSLLTLPDVTDALVSVGFADPTILANEDPFNTLLIVAVNST